MRRWLLLTGVVLSMLLVCDYVGCDHGGRPDPSHPSRGWASRVDAEDSATQRVLAQALKGSREFSLCLSEGAGNYGYDSVVVQGGKCRLLLTTPMFRGGYKNLARRRYGFTLSPAENVILLNHLRNVAALPRLYSSGIADGTQVFVAMIVDGHRKEVYCDNYFPKQVVGLRNYLFNELVPSRQSDVTITDTVRNETMNYLW